METLILRTNVVAAFLAVACLPSVLLADDPPVGVIVEDNWGYGLVSELSKASKDKGCPVAPEMDLANESRFTKGDCQVVIWTEYPGITNSRRKGWVYGFKAEAMKDSTFVIGQAKVAVITSRNSSLQSLSVDEIRALVADSVTATAPTAVPKRFQCFVETARTPSRRILRQTCLGYDKSFPFGALRCYWPFRKEMTECSNRNEIIAKVKTTPNSIGFILDDGIVPNGVKTIPVAAKGNTRPARLTESRCIQDDYPLAGSLVLYVHPDKPQAVMQFVKFAVGPEGSKIAEKHGLVTSWMNVQYCAELRLKDMKSGKGVHLSTIGVDDGSKTVSDLATEYVKAKAVVQLGYSASESDVSAIGAFVWLGADTTTSPADSAAAGDASVSDAPASMPASAPAVQAITPFVKAGGKELLFLDGKPSDQAMKLHGEKWNALGPDGTGPTEYVLAGRAVAVIVNPANKLEALSLAQVRAIFGGEVDDWAIIGGTGLSGATGVSPVGSAGGTPAKLADGTSAPLADKMSAPRTAGGMIRINAFGLYANAPATGVFEKECLTRDKWKRATAKKDTAEAIAAVSMDPRAIAFVDLSAIPASGQTVKVLGIRMNVGKTAGETPAGLAGKMPVPRIYMPTAENIKNAMYPLSQRLFLYVHPKAGDTAKDFAKFIATCGGSEASPYADTVKAVMETYQKHGLIPLADAAIQRAAKDAMSEAKAKEAASQAAKGKRK